MSTPMSMPKITLAYAASLIALGVGAYLLASSAAPAAPAVPATQPAPNHLTALIPAFAGLIFLALGAASLAKDSLRKHLMHAAAALGLLLALAGLGMSLNKLIPAGFDLSALARPRATVSQLLMGLLSVVFVFLCVLSFRAARRARTI